MTDQTNKFEKDQAAAWEWAEYISSARELHGTYAPQARAAARLILASTTPPTMAEVEWRKGVHDGLCARLGGAFTVRMLGPDPDHDSYILVVVPGGRIEAYLPAVLTPIPGTRVDLTPSSEPAIGPDMEQVSADSRIEAWEVVCRHPFFKSCVDEDIPLLDSMVRKLDSCHKPAPHPEFLQTEEDYKDAPQGTIVASDGAGPYVLAPSGWRFITGELFDYAEMAGQTRRVLRWGWG